MPHPAGFAAAFDPDAFKRASYAVIGDAGVKLRAHSWDSYLAAERKSDELFIEDFLSNKAAQTNA